MAESMLTIVILTKNEEHNLSRCLDAIPPRYQIVILDSGSTDRTLSIAKSRGCSIHKNEWPGFAAQRNYALEYCNITSNWVLFVDADEIFPPEFYEWFEAVVNGTKNLDAVLIPSNLVFCGKRLLHAPGYPIYHTRLVRTKKIRFIRNYAGHGETIPNEYKTISCPISYDHYIYNGDLVEWMHKHINNATKEVWASSVNGAKMTRRAQLNRLAKPSIFRIIARFLYHYFWCRGFCDGRSGFNYSLMYSWYEMTKYTLKHTDDRR